MSPWWYAFPDLKDIQDSKWRALMGNVRAVSIPPGTAVFHAGETCRSYLIVLESSVRTVVGLGILSLAFIGPQTDWGYLGLVPLATGLIGWCPAYMPFGVITCKTS